SDVFIENNNTNLVTPEGFAVGRQVSKSNSLIPGVIWDFAPQTSLRANLSYVLQRFSGQSASSSDVVRLPVDVFHNFSPQLTGIVGFEAAYIRVEGQPDTTTQTPRIGATYRFTATRTGTLVVGPQFRETSGDWGASPYVAASFNEEFYWGLAGLTFAHLVGTAGGLGGTTENTSIGGFVSVTNLLRDLRVELAPRYSIAKSTGPSSATNNVDAKAFTIDLRASYQFTPWLAAVAGYRFFHQRSDTTTTTFLTNNVDQNRVFFGVQFGAPIKFD